MSAVILTEELVAFCEGPVGIIVAACDSSLQSSVAFAYGCRVAPDRSRVTITVLASQAEVLLADIRATARIAVNFARPTTSRSIQLKGHDARIEPVRAQDLAQVTAHTRAFTEELLPLREMSEAAMAALFGYTQEDLVAISFSPCDGFSQTPGPGAGARLT